MSVTSLLSRSKTYCCVTTSNQLRSTSSPRWASSHSFSLMSAVTWVPKASSFRPDRRSPKLTRNSSIFASTNSELWGGRKEALNWLTWKPQLKSHRYLHLNFVAWVSTVTENPSTPDVFLQVGYTWYLEVRKSEVSRLKTQWWCGEFCVLAPPAVSLRVTQIWTQDRLLLKVFDFIQLTLSWDLLSLLLAQGGELFTDGGSHYQWLCCYGNLFQETCFINTMMLWFESVWQLTGRTLTPVSPLSSGSRSRAPPCASVNTNT